MKFNGDEQEHISHIQLYAFTGGTKGGDHQIIKKMFNISVCSGERVAAGLCGLYGESIVSYRSGP